MHIKGNTPFYKMLFLGPTCFFFFFLGPTLNIVCLVEGVCLIRGTLNRGFTVLQKIVSHIQYIVVKEVSKEKEER